MTVSTTSRFQPNAERVAAKVMDGEAVIIDLTTGTYYSLAEAGGRIWELIDARLPVEQAIDVITGEYAIPRERAAADLHALMSRLIDEQLIVPVAEGLAPITSAAVAAPRPSAYQTPELQVYRDMQDLLALDPPMPGLGDIPWK